MMRRVFGIIIFSLFVIDLDASPQIKNRLKPHDTNQHLLGKDFCSSINFFEAIKPEHLDWTVAMPLQGPAAGIRQAGAEAFLQDDLHHYTNEEGHPDLVRLIQDKFISQGLRADHGQVVIDNSLFHIISKFLSLLDWKEGDVVLLPVPTFGQHPYLLAQHNIPFAMVPGKAKNSGKITPEDLDQALTKSSAKVFIFTNPLNPTGAVYSRGELIELARVLRKHGTFVISDEIFSDLVLTPTHQHTSLGSLEGMDEYVLTLNGIGKSKGLAGLRFSYGLIPSWLSAYWPEPICGISAPIEKAAISALKVSYENEVYQNELKAKYRERLARVKNHVLQLESQLQLKRPSSVPYIEVYGDPVATNVCLLRFPGLYRAVSGDHLITSGNDLALYLLSHAGVALSPGEIFYVPDDRITLRITLSAKKLDEGFKKISTAIMNLDFPS